MNELTLKIFDGTRVTYLYRPEGRGKVGEITYSLGDNEAVVAIRAEEDNNAEHYGYKAAKKVKERADANILPIRFVQAWN